MSVIILHDEGEDRAVLYCNTSETPLPWGFTGEPGVSAYDVAADFQAWFTAANGSDVRFWKTLYNTPERAADQWRDLAYSPEHEYIGWRR